MAVDLREVRGLERQQDDVQRLLAAYDMVRSYASQKLNHGSITLSVLNEHRRDLKKEAKRLNTAMLELRDRCQHAWEKIGEAKPPFWRCVNCAGVSAVEPRTW